MDTNDTEKRTKLYLVDAEVLPEVFENVLKAKELLRCGKADTVNNAVNEVGISRSAFYKYKDKIFRFSEKSQERIITLHVMLRDEAGVLSEFITALYRSGANILTISQNIPVRGRAMVSVSASMRDPEQSTTELIKTVKSVNGVISIEEITGE